MNIAIIPARGGSKRIPRKNIRNFCGLPMIAWSIQAAQKAGIFDRIIVSTDDFEISKIAKKYGAEVPFMRNITLANDYTPTLPVISNALENINANEDDLVCCIYPTAPFLEAFTILNSFEFFKKTKNTNFLVSITSFGYPLDRALVKSQKGEIRMINPDNTLVRSQDLQDYYHDAGQFYWATCETWTKKGVNIFAESTFGFILPTHKVQDIDTEEDWLRAELMMTAYLNINKQID
jgi:pseudaminic acid cytidylyltransferase